MQIIDSNDVPRPMPMPMRSQPTFGRVGSSSAQKNNYLLLVVVVILIIVLLQSNSLPMPQVIQDHSDVAQISRSLAVESGECVNPGAEIWSTLSTTQRAVYALSCIDATTK